MDKKFLKAKDIAQLWGITPRRVNQLCTAGFINGAYKEGRYWLIPSDTTKPEILRNKQTPPLSGRLLPCPVGITSYKEVSKECYYVDKTLLIKDIIDDHSKVYLFTRPRRFVPENFAQNHGSVFSYFLQGKFAKSFALRVPVYYNRGKNTVACATQLQEAAENVVFSAELR